MLAAGGLIIALRYAVSTRAMRLGYDVAFSGSAKLRVSLLRRLTRRPLGAFVKLHAGRIAQTLSEDMVWQEQEAAYFRLNGYGDMAAIAALLAGVTVLHWPAAVTAVLVWGLGYLVARHYSRILERGLAFRSAGFIEASRQFMEYAEGIQVVRAFGGSNTSASAYRDWTERMRAGFRRGIAKNTPISTLAEALAATAVGLGGVVTILTIPDSDSGLQAVGAVCVLTAALIPARSIISTTAVTRLAEIGARNVAEIEALPELLEGAKTTEPGPARVTFENVSFSYDGDSNALDGISFDAEPGTVTAIVGRSGSGKTTLANLILRFWDPSEGRVLLNGEDARDFTLESYADRFAPVFQETVLFRDTVAANIRVGRPDASEEEVIAAAKAARIHETIIALPEGYQTRVGPGGSTLSGGERQRITIARALLKDADVVILDEATSALDPENERDIQMAFAALAERKTVFVIAHRLATVIDADTILLLDAGRIVAKGRHSDLIASQPLYRTLWESYEAISEWTL